MSDTEKLTEGCFQFLVALGLVALTPFVTRDLWNWFVVPVFGAPALTYATALGLGALKALLTYRYNNEKQGWEHLGAGVFLYLFCWGLGALAR